MPGLYSVDHPAWHDLDIQADLNEPLSDLPDDSVAEIYIRHDLNHVFSFVGLMMELHRVTKPEGRIEIVVPHFSNPDYNSKTTHVRTFGLNYFFRTGDSGFQTPQKSSSLSDYFRIESFQCRLRQETLWDRLLGFVVEPLIKVKVNWFAQYERRLCRWILVNDIRLILRPKKVAKSAAPIPYRVAA